MRLYQFLPSLLYFVAADSQAVITTDLVVYCQTKCGLPAAYDVQFDKTSITLAVEHDEKNEGWFECVNKCHQATLPEALLTLTDSSNSPSKATSDMISGAPVTPVDTNASLITAASSLITEAPVIPTPQDEL